MVAFAVYGDLEARWRPLSADEQAQATVLLEDASTRIRLECTRAGVDADTDVDAAVTLMIACAMVKRAMISSGSEGIQSQMNVAGPFTQQQSFANPSGNLYLTKQERRDLGLGQVAGMVNMGPEGDYVPRENFPGEPINWWEMES